MDHHCTLWREREGAREEETAFSSFFATRAEGGGRRMQRWLEALLFILSAAWLIFPACTSGLLPSSQAETESSHANNAFQPSSLLSIGMALTLVLHVMFEGANWQGFICYAVCSVAVTDSVLSIFGLLEEVPYAVNVGLRALGILLLGAFAALWILLPVPKLQPVRRPIGMREWMFDASTRKSQRTADRAYLTSRGVPDIPDKIRVRLWYPTDATSGTRAPYLKATSLAAMMDVFFGIREGTWQRKLLQIISSHVPLALGNSFIDAPIDNTQSRWPLIVLSHGLKGAPEIYTAVGEQLASLGYLVAAPVHTDGSAGERFKGIFPFEKPVVSAQLAERARDISFTVDQLQALPEIQDRVDWSCIAVSGHSFGGTTCPKVLQTDKRFLTGVGWDTWSWPLTEQDMATAFDRSILFIQSDWFLVGEGREENMERIERVCKNAKGGSGGYLMTVSETAHHNYNDLPLFASPHLIRYIRSKSDPPRLFGSSDGYTVHSLTAEATHLFAQWQWLNFGNQSETIDNDPSSGRKGGSIVLGEGERRYHPAPALFTPHLNADISIEKPTSHTWKNINLHITSFGGEIDKNRS